MPTDETKKITYSHQFEEFLQKYVEYDKDLANEAERKENDKVVSSVVLFEKVRAAIEYQEAHVVLKMPSPEFSSAIFR